MPLLHRKPFVKNRLPANLKNEEEVFHCTVTNEIFRDYDEFFDRLILCNSLVWKCSITGKPGLTYQEALECEAKGRKTLSSFPEHLPKIMLFLATLTKRTRLYDINDDIFAFISVRFFVQELIEANIQNMKKTCRILSIISPEESNDEDINGETQYKNSYPPEQYKYNVIDMKTKKESIVTADKILRKKGSYTRDKSRIFLKSHCEVNKFGQWIVKPKSVTKYALNNFIFTDFFPSKCPEFVSSLKCIDSIFAKVSAENAHDKAMQSKNKDGKVMTQAEIYTERNLAIEKMKMDKLKEREKARDERLLKIKQVREEKLQKELDLKNYMKPREDLACDDLMPLPLANDIDVVDGVTPLIFSSTLAVVEFLASFGDMLDVTDVFPTGIKFKDLLDSILEENTQGTYIEVLTFLLTNLFSFIDGEMEDIGNKPSNGTAAVAIENGSDDEEEDSAAKQVIVLASHWSMEKYGIGLHDIPIDSSSVSEILRIHLSMSGQTAHQNLKKYHYQQRGGYTASDDPGVQLKSESDLVTRLVNESVFDLAAGDKLLVLSTLIGQLMTYIMTRDFIEDGQEKLKMFRAEQRLHQNVVSRRERDETSFWWHKKSSDRMKCKMETIKKNETQKKLTDCNITMKTSPSAASKETPPPAPAEVVPADGPPVVVVELVKFNVPSIRNTNRSCDPSNGAAGKGNEFIIPDPMASCPTENIDWNSITSEERSRIMTFNEQRTSYLTNKIASLIQTTISLKLGRDRCYRRFYLFNSLPGIYIEEIVEYMGDHVFAGLIQQKIVIKEAAICEQVVDESGNVKEIKESSEKEIKDSSDKEKKDSSDKENESNESNEDITKEVMPTQSVEEQINMNGTRIWTCLDTMPQVEALIASLSNRGHREIALKATILEYKSLIEESISSSFSKSRYIKMMKNKSKPIESTSLKNELIWSVIDLEERVYSGSLGKLKRERVAWLAELNALDDNPDEESEVLVKSLTKVVIEIYEAVEDKYIGEPLGSTYHKTNRRSAVKSNKDKNLLVENAKKNIIKWKMGLDECTSLSQVYIMMGILDRSIIWARSVLQAHCKICRRKRDEDKMLLCDACNCGHHMFCLKPPMKKVPEGDWFCPECCPKEKINTPRKRNRSVMINSDDDEAKDQSNSDSENSKPQKKVPKARRKVFAEEEQETEDVKQSKKPVKKGKAVEEEVLKSKKGRKRKRVDYSSDENEEVSPKRVKGRSGRMVKVVKYNESDDEQLAPIPEEGAVTKRKYAKRSSTTSTASNSKPTDADISPRRGRKSDIIKDSNGKNKRNSQDFDVLNECSRVLKEVMECNEAWPFMRPISKKIAPDYDEFIKKRMDFSKITTKTNQGEYYSDPLGIIDDARLIFANCSLYNKDDTEEYEAGVVCNTLLDKLIKQSRILKSALKFRSIT